MPHEEAYTNPAFQSDGDIANGKSRPRGFQKHVVVGEIPNDRATKWRIIKNVIVISFAFTFLFTSFNAMVNLQSSINKTLGTTSLWVLYAALVFSCAFLPTIMIKKLKVKWTIALSMLCYSTYMAAQFYPTYYTLIPTAILLGLGAAPMWSAKCTYLTVVGKLYGELVGETSEVIITRFFGIFFLFFQSSQVIGNFISSSILSVGVSNSTRSEEFLEICGSSFCPAHADNLTSDSAQEQSDDERQKRILMSGIFLGCALASSAIIALFVDSLARYGENEREKAKENASGLQLLLATFRHLKNPFQILIIPLTFWSGVEQSFIGADFTQAFVTCGLGLHMVGYVMICYGVCDAICSIGFTPLVKTIGRIPIFVFGAFVNIVMILIMLLWSPTPNQIAVFFFMAALWGIADAIWQTQINALYGVIFPGTSEAAFSNYRLWESLGFILGYNLSSAVCMTTKIYVLLGVLGIGMAGYLAIEIAIFLNKRKTFK